MLVKHLNPHLSFQSMRLPKLPNFEVPIFCVNKELRIEEWNQKIEQLTGSPGPRDDDGMMDPGTARETWREVLRRWEKNIFMRCCIYKDIT